MSLKRKLISLTSLFIILLIATNSIIQWVETAQLKKQTDDVITELHANSEKHVTENLNELAAQISNHIVALEKEVDKNILNAAYTLQQMDATKALTNEDLGEIAKQTGMTDLYLTDAKGEFIRSTEEASLGLNLVSMVSIYGQILSGESSLIDGPLMLKLETGEIFKFTAIPRLDNKGIIEAALNAELFEDSLTHYLQEGNGVEALYLIDSSGLVLTENLNDGQESLWEKGEQINNQDVQKVTETSKPSLNIADKSATIFYPIVVNDSVRYVLSAQVDTTPYYINSSIAEESLEQVQSNVSHTANVTLVSSLILTFVLITVLILFIRKSFKPLEAINEHAQKIAQGDLTSETIEVNSKDEIGTLATSFNKMSENLREVLHKVSFDSQQVAASAEELTASAEQMSHASEHISSTVQEVAAGTDEQVKEMNETDHTVTNMLEYAQQISESSLGATKKAHETSTNAADGNKAIQTAVSQMNTIHGRVSETSKVIEELGSYSNQIGEISKVITDIADQTNLLALNAAIEAARAGEQGKGFAVVADEVRKLAEQSSQSSSQISHLINRIQEETSRAVNSMQNVTAEVGDGIGIVNKAGTTFGDIQVAVDEVNHQITGVSTSVEQLRHGMEQMVQVVKRVKQVSEDNNSGTQNISAATEEQLASMQEISSSAVSLTNMAEELMELIGKFKI
ncbi:methyl-accepting chemotaxis protein [Metabacillus litoralis]|uniref:methyl-accepting chemotaxis protein n=1 Tax=Metabacillus litoralis TaxID=152268 RepID=UPI00203B45D5|nr:methyl-accepting chemotaxis protein [Metabacillus litoralis]MCM3162230.1 methyl-accepting chemotaxis protein [Metabacillus litoralis]